VHDAIIDKHVKCPLLKINTNKYFILIGLCRSLIQSLGYFSVTPLAAENKIVSQRHLGTLGSPLKNRVDHSTNLTHENPLDLDDIDRHFTPSLPFKEPSTFIGSLAHEIHFPAVPRTITSIGQCSRMIAHNY
jgi:hypothetical protein